MKGTIMATRKVRARMARLVALVIGLPALAIGLACAQTPRLLPYDGRMYMVANAHDGQVMYYRRDLFNDPVHQAAFRKKYGYALAVPRTWDQFRDAAEYFNGKDLNGDGVPDHGVSMHL